MKEEFTEEQRAQDIILGALGFGEDAKIIELHRTKTGFAGKGAFADGDEFTFENEDEVSELEQWALRVLRV